MRSRAARSFRADLLELGLAEQVALELYRAATGQSTQRRARTTVEVAEKGVRRLLAGDLDVDAVFRRVWGVGVNTYFTAQSTPTRRTLGTHY